MQHCSFIKCCSTCLPKYLFMQTILIPFHPFSSLSLKAEALFEKVLISSMHFETCKKNQCREKQEGRFFIINKRKTGNILQHMLQVL